MGGRDNGGAAEVAATLNKGSKLSISHFFHYLLQGQDVRLRMCRRNVTTYDLDLGGGKGQDSSCELHFNSDEM